MAKVAYLDCPTGIAGDMCLGAIVDAGMPLDYLDEQLATLGISDEYMLRVETVHRNGQRATKVHVDLVQVDLPLPKATRHPHSHDHNHSHDYNHSHISEEPSELDYSNEEHHATDHHGTRHLPDIEKLIHTAPLPARVKSWSLSVFQQLAKAEG
ncbi:nickel insertion protein, partial [Okeania sp. SIO2G5]|uniref:nickel insertion protein n=1 Tax=Okeania sp. SIO2G5 TaxID=2607796 RepID=UPI0013C0DBAA